MPKPTTADLLAALLSFREAVETRFNYVDRRFESVDQRFDAIDPRFDAMDRRFDRLEQRLETLETTVGVGFVQLNDRLGKLESLRY